MILAGRIETITPMDNTEIQSILQSLGERLPPGSELILIGGSALTLLGSPRPTIDIDFIGDDVQPCGQNKFFDTNCANAREV